jgi:peptidoglycan/LPS O-acetylase OafA/YrhL
MPAPDPSPLAAAASPASSAPRSPWRPVVWLWTLALLLSALLVAAGQHWPQPLVPEPRAVWALVLGLPLLMALRLLVGDRGESGDRAQGQR